MRGGCGGIGFVFYDGQPVQFCYAIDAKNLPAAENIGSGVACGDEEVAPRQRDLVDMAGAEETRAGRLYEIVDVAEGGKLRAEIGAQRRLVRLHFFSEPLRMLGVQGGTGLGSFS